MFQITKEKFFIVRARSFIIYAQFYIYFYVILYERVTFQKICAHQTVVRTKQTFYLLYINLDVWGWLAGWLVYLRGWGMEV